MSQPVPPNYGPVELFAAEQVFRGLDGVYAIFAYVGPFGVPIDVGESEDVGKRLRDHDRKDDWFSLVWGFPVVLKVWATPTPAGTWHAKAYRLWVEKGWRLYYRLMGYALCGQRP